MDLVELLTLVAQDVVTQRYEGRTSAIEVYLADKGHVDFRNDVWYLSDRAVDAVVGALLAEVNVLEIVEWLSDGRADDLLNEWERLRHCDIAPLTSCDKDDTIDRLEADYG